MSKRTVPANGKKLTALRMAKGWNQSELAEKAKCSEATVNKAENGGSVYLTTIRQFAAALDVNHSVLMIQEQSVLHADTSAGSGMRPTPVQEPIGDTEESDSTDTDTSTLDIELTINRKFDSYTSKEQERLLAAITDFLNIDGITVLSKRRGSVKLTLQLSAEEAESLLAAVNDGVFAEFGVTSARLLTTQRRSAKVLAYAGVGGGSEYPPGEEINDDDVEGLWLEYRDRPTLEVRNRLVERYMSLVKYNAERIWARLPDGVDLEDLISAGIFALMDAIDAFDLTRGVKFETYCVPRIRGAILDELRTMDWVPRLVRSKASKTEAARKELEATLGRPPRPEEMAAKLGIPLEQLDTHMGEATAGNLVSLNKKWYETDSYKDVREIDILQDMKTEEKKAEDPTRRLQNRDLMRLVTRGLNRNERLIVILYYYEEMTMKEIGAHLGLSESRVSQMHGNIVKRLTDELQKRRSDFGRN